MSTLRPAILFGLLAITTTSAQNNFSATNLLRPDFWDTDGTVNALLATNGMLYLGGSFSLVGPKGRQALALDRHTGATQPDFPSIIGSSIHTIIDDSSGGWFLGGDFVEVGGQPRTNLVHIRSDYSIDPTFHPHPGGPVNTLALEGDMLFVGGDFERILDQPQAHLAALSLSTGLLQPWPEADGKVITLLLNRNLLFLGGAFTSVAGQPRNRIAALDRTTGTLTTWNPDTDGHVVTLAIAGDTLFAGGSFNRIGGQLRNGLAAIDLATDSNNATSWDPRPEGGKVAVVRVECQTVYVGGYFTNINGLQRHRAAAIDLHSGLAADWNPNLELASPSGKPSSVLTLEVSGDTVYLGGEFSRVSTESRHDLAAVSAATSEVLPWAPNPGGSVSSLSVSGRSVLAGFLKSPGGVERNNLAAIDTTTGQATDWNPGTDGPVFALAIASTNVFVGGNFTRVGGFPRTNLVAIDTTTGQVRPDWDASTDEEVLALATSTVELLVGGRFSTMAGHIRHRFAALNLATGFVDPWTPVFDNAIHTLLPVGDILYAGGSFITVDGQTRRRLASLDLWTRQLTAFNPGLDQRVRCLAHAGNTLYVGGDFRSISGLSRDYLGAVDPAFGTPAPWAPFADAEVRSLLVTGNAIYLAGTFLNLSGSSRPGCGAVDFDGALLDWNPGTSTANRIHALALDNQALVLGGTGSLRFQSSPATHSLAAFPQAGAPTLVQPLPHLEVPAGQDALFHVDASGEDPLHYQWFASGTPLPGATNATLAITNTTALDSGIYTVIVTNPLGAITAQADLTVLEPINILAQPSSQSHTAPGNIVLSVLATGSPAPAYQWRRNGVNIPGAVRPVFMIAGAEPADGGSYQIVVANRLGAVISDIASVIVESPPLPFADNVADTVILTDANRTGSGNNSNATPEPAEPLHAGKMGGASVWLRWTPPADGIATFDTRGSGFDTLLAIYTGENGGPAMTTMADDDRGGFHTSRLSFNALAGTDYFIAVDGLAGATGEIVLAWTLDTNNSIFPRILTQPLSQSVATGSSVSFAVDVASPTALSYQWYFGCQEIPNATNQTLLLSNVQPGLVGSYHVVVQNASTQPAISLDASLEIGPDPAALSFDKLEDALARYRSVVPSGGSGGGAPGGFILVSFGSIVTQTFRTTDNTTSLLETNHCGTAGGASAWLVFETENDGVVLVDTVGSDFDTVLSVYYPTNIANLPSALVACDNNGAPDGIRSQLRFQAGGGTPYLVVVDGIDGATGLARIRWALGLAPTLDPATTNTVNELINPGDPVTLRVTLLGGTPPPIIHWLRQGNYLPGATNAELHIADFQLINAGEYSVIVSNFAGVVTTTSANIRVDSPPQIMNVEVLGNGEFRGEIIANPGDAFLLQVSPNLRNWLDLQTNRIVDGPVVFTDSEARQHPARFYRARMRTVSH